jgi:protein subunit release factor B
MYAKLDKRNPTQWKVKVSMLDDEKKALQKWILGFTPENFPKDICTVTFSRSSGPGGQNVNKYISLLLLADEG